MANCKREKQEKVRQSSKKTTGARAQLPENRSKNVLQGCWSSGQEIILQRFQK
jgi:hypothetical protein